MLLEKGVEVSHLLNSNVFQYEFFYDDWPSTHTNNQVYIRPFNHNIFNIRGQYKKVFPEDHFQEIIDVDGGLT